MFFLPRNLVNIGLAITILGILAMAQTVVIVSGGLDISVGSIVGLATMVVAIAMQATGSAALGIGAALGAAALAGLVNGLIITYGRVNAVIATLGTMAAFRGFAFLTSGGSSVSIVNEQFRVLGNGVLLFFPCRSWCCSPSWSLFAVFLNTTVVGRNIYAIGGNPTVARLAGIPIRRYQIGIYILRAAARPASPASCSPRAPCPASRPRAARAWSSRRSRRPSWAAAPCRAARAPSSAPCSAC